MLNPADENYEEKLYLIKVQIVLIETSPVYTHAKHLPIVSQPPWSNAC